MALAYTAPTWTDGSGEGISASNLQAISNCIEGLVQGSDKAVHGISMSGSTITLTFADGSQETATMSGLKGISSIAKTGSSGLVDTYTVTYTDGTTSTFTVTNGAAGSAPTITMTASADATSSPTPTVAVTKTGTDENPNFALAFSGLKGSKGDTGDPGPAGQDGQDGQDGADGFSPAVTITTITGGHRVNITDEDHPAGQNFDVMDGQDGASDWSDIQNKPNFATVATSGSYADLSNTPDLTTLEKKGVELTQAQYDALAVKDPLVDYYITDGQTYPAIDDSDVSLSKTWSSNKIHGLLGLKIKTFQSSTYTANGTNTYKYFLQQMFSELTTAISNLGDNEYLWLDSIFMTVQMQQNRNHFYKKGDAPTSISVYGIFENSASTQIGYYNSILSATLNDNKRAYMMVTFSNNSVSSGDNSGSVPTSGTAMYLNYYIMEV